MVHKIEKSARCVALDDPSERVREASPAATEDDDVSMLRAILDRRDNELVKLRRMTQAQAVEIATLRSQLQMGADRITDLERGIIQRFDEIAALTKMLSRERAASLQSVTSGGNLGTTRESDPKHATEDTRQRIDRGLQHLQHCFKKLRRYASKEPSERSAFKTQKALLAMTPLFDADWYLARYHDVALAGIDPISHYLKHGANEGRNPGPSFDTIAYRRAHPEIGSANPLVDFISRQQRSRKNG